MPVFCRGVYFAHSRSNCRPHARLSDAAHPLHKNGIAACITRLQLAPASSDRRNTLQGQSSALLDAGSGCIGSQLSPPAGLPAGIPASVLRNAWAHIRACTHARVQASAKQDTVAELTPSRMGVLGAPAQRWIRQVLMGGTQGEVGFTGGAPWSRSGRSWTKGSAGARNGHVGTRARTHVRLCESLESRQEHRGWAGHGTEAALGPVRQNTRRVRGEPMPTLS